MVKTCSSWRRLLRAVRGSSANFMDVLFRLMVVVEGRSAAREWSRRNGRDGSLDGEAVDAARRGACRVNGSGGDVGSAAPELLVLRPARNRRRALVLVTEYQASLAEVVGRHLDGDTVARQRLDAIFLHLAGRIG